MNRFFALSTGAVALFCSVSLVSHPALAKGDHYHIDNYCFQVDNGACGGADGMEDGYPEWSAQADHANWISNAVPGDGRSASAGYWPNAEECTDGGSCNKYIVYTIGEGTLPFAYHPIYDDGKGAYVNYYADVTISDTLTPASQTIQAGDTATLTWGASKWIDNGCVVTNDADATKITVLNSAADDSGKWPADIYAGGNHGGKITVGPLTKTTIYTITCTGDSRDNTGDTATVQASATVTITANNKQPDLVSSAVTPSSATAQAATDFTATISNDGDATTGASFHDIFEFCPGAAFDSSKCDTVDEIKGNGGAISIATPDPIGPLDADGGATDSKPVSATESLVAGTWYVRACANTGTGGATPASDYDGNPESDYTNNCGPANAYNGWTKVTVKNPSKPDLIADDPAAQGVPQVNVPVQLSSLITNDSGTATGCPGKDMYGSTYCFGNFFEVDDDTHHDNWRVGGVDYFSNAGLEGYRGRESSITYTFPHDGTWYVRACADTTNGKGANNYVDESNEDNNCSEWAPIDVADTANLPDLTATYNGPKNAIDQNQTALLGTITNSGTDTGTDFPNVFEINPDQIPDAFGDIHALRSVRAGPLGNGAHQDVSVNYTFNNEFDGYTGNTRTWYVRICADTDTNNGNPLTVEDPDNLCSGWMQVVVANFSNTGGGGGGGGECSNPQATISANPTRVIPGSFTTLSWSASGIPAGDTCSITGPNFSRTTPPANDACVVSPGDGEAEVDAQSTYTITCPGASDSVTVDVAPHIIEF